MGPSTVETADPIEIQSTRRTAIGIGPGLDGATVVIGPNGHVADAVLMPTLKTGRGWKWQLDIRTLLETLLRWKHANPVVALEQARARPAPKMGAASGIATGRTHGATEAVIVACGFTYDLVLLRRWQSDVCPGTDDPRARSVAAARRLLPDLDLTPGRRVKPHDGLADARGLALYARRALA